MTGTHRGPHSSTYVYIQLCKRGRGDVENQVDMHTYILMHVHILNTVRDQKRGD